MTALTVTTSAGIKAGDPARLDLLIPGTDGKPVRDFDSVHDAKVHLIVVRQGLDQFAHLHPEVDAANGRLSVTHTFAAGGTYHLFADYQPRGGRPATATATVQVSGDAPAAPPLAPDVPGTVRGDGLAAKVSIDGAQPGREATIRFELSDPAGRPVTDLEPYMGAMGHLVVISADATKYVHAHPADGKAAVGGVVSFAAHFPHAGIYKGFGQFQQGRKVRVVPFVVRVP